MTKWDWVAKTGAFGEIPVKILQNERAEFLLDVEEDITIDSYDITSGEQVVPGDVCIFKAKIIDATQSNNRFLIEIEVNRVEFVRKIEGADREIQEMMDHLDTAKAVQSEKRGRV